MGKKPWINGIIDGISASNLVRISTIEHKNRIAFIILDSTLEMTMKKYIENVKKLSNITESTWKNRETINKIVKKHQILMKTYGQMLIIFMVLELDCIMQIQKRQLLIPQ